MKLLMWIDSSLMDIAANFQIHEYAGNRDVLITTDIDLVLKSAAEIDIVLGNFPREHLSSLPKLIWFQQFGTGVEWLSEHPYLIKAPFVLTNCSDDHHDVVADHLMALMLSVTRNIPQFVNSQSKNQWQSTSLTECKNLFQLRGKTVLVVGLGSVGLAIIKRLVPFGVKIIGVRKNITKSVEHVSKLFNVDELNIAAKEANIVVSSLPKTAETSDLFNEAFFNALASPSFFFNIGRGNAVNETALINALETGQLNGAGIDVTIEEPLNKESSFWTTPNLLITPHVGGTYNDVMKTWRDIALNNLCLYQEGKELRNVVDKKSGY